jgi:hypothetical protein
LVGAEFAKISPGVLAGASAAKTVLALDAISSKPVMRTRTFFIASLSNQLTVILNLTLKILASNPGHQDPERADERDDEGWEVEELVDENANRRGSGH